MTARLSKNNIRRLAEYMAESRSHGTKIDPDGLAERLWKSTRRCILCQKPSYIFGLFFPNEKADPILRVGLRAHQQRTLAYGLCVKCSQHEDATERVERRLADAFLLEANIRAELDAQGIEYTTESTPDGQRFLSLGSEASGEEPNHE